ncbi:MAG TPA: class I SAM-dependent methyltransferase [Dissulfurispiraceae bacterium]|nr:class I SAM-dependent methyltransferase [Dissulfurispiraceae bacterium]
MSTTPVLDLGCGTGRIAIALAQSGVSVVGVDISMGMLAKAQYKADGEGEHIRNRVTFVHADMRNYSLYSQYDFAYIGFRSFMLLLDVEGQIDALRNTVSHLTSGGRLVVSLFVPTIERLSAYGMSPRDEYRYFREFPHPNGVYKIIEYEKKWCDEYRQIGIHKLRHVSVDEQGNEVETVERSLLIRWTHRFEFQHLVRYCGYEVEGVFGDYRCSPLGSTSTEMIWVLRRTI